MSAEEERAANGGEVASTDSASSTTETAVTESAPAESTTSDDAVASTTNESSEPSDVAAAPSKEVASNDEASKTEMYDPGIPSDSATSTEPTLVKPEGNASSDSLPLSGEMASKEVAPSKDAAVSVDSSLDTSGLNTPPSSMSNEPTLAMPSFGGSSEPTLVTPKKAAKKKSRAKKTTQVSENEVVNTPAPVVEKAPASVAAKAVAVSQTTQAINPNVTEKNGVKMNRYYFLRPGDHTEKVSELLYGNRAMGDKLLAWNGGIENWVPGNMVWYNSPMLQNDSTLKSFYEESHVNMKEHKVAKGENLKVLAARFYGDIRCWSELAHINHLGKDSSNVGEGQVLKFAPEKLATTVQAEVKPAVTEEEDPFLVADNKQRDINQIKKDKKSLASAEVGSFIMNNLFLIVTVTIALGLIVFMMKRKEKDPMEF